MKVPDRPKSPLPSVSRLIPSVTITKPAILLPTMSKLYGKPYRHDEPLLGSYSQQLSRGEDSNDNHRDSKKHKKLASAEKAHLKNLALVVKHKAKAHAISMIQLKPNIVKRDSYYGYSAESRDDELDERHLLTTTAGYSERFMSFDSERDMPVTLSEVVDFGGFEEDMENVYEEREATETTVSVSSSSVQEEEHTSIDSSEYSRMYAAITMGVIGEQNENTSVVTECDSSEEIDSSVITECDRSEESDPSVVTECDRSHEHVVSVSKECEVSVESVKTMEEMNNAHQLIISGDFSVASVVSVKSVGSSKEPSESSASDRSRTSPYLLGLNLKESEKSVPSKYGTEIDVFDAISVVSSTAPSSILHGMDFVETTECEDVVEVYTSQSDSSQVDQPSDQDVVARELESSTLDDLSYTTPEPTKLPTIPTTTFSVDNSPSMMDRQFMISENPVIVTPTDHDDVVEIGGISAAYSEEKCDDEGTNDPDFIKIDFEPKIKDPEVDDKLTTEKTPMLVSSSSEESATSNSTTTALSFSGLQLHNFDDDIFNATQLEEESVTSDFNIRDDWQPQDDTDSVCTQPFGCCSINVDVKCTILNNSTPCVEELPDPSTPRRSFVASKDWDLQKDVSGSTSNAAIGSCIVSYQVKTNKQAGDKVVPVHELSPPSTPRPQPIDECGFLINEVTDEDKSKKGISIDELSPPNTPTKIISSSEQPKTNVSPRFVYPEISMLDIVSDESEYGSSNSNGSSQLDSFRLIGRFNLNEYMDSNSVSSLVQNGEDVAIPEGGIDSADNVEENSSANETMDEVSCASNNILNESGRSFSVTSDDGGDFELLKHFWAKEWSGVTKERSSGLKDSSAYDTDYHSFSESQKNLRYDYTDDTDNRLYISRTHLETVKEEMAEESVDDNCSSAANTVKRDALEDVIEQGVHLMSVDKSGDDSSTVSAYDIQDSSEEFKHLVVGGDSDTNMVDYSEQDDDVYLGDVEVCSTLQCQDAFRSQRSSKKQYARAKKWAVAKAKSRSAVKFSLNEVNIDSFHMKKVDDSPISTPSEVDEIVKSALALISKHATAEVEENPTPDEHSLLTTFESNDPPAIFQNCTPPPAIISCEPQNEPIARLGQLEKYLSQTAKKSQQRNADTLNEIINDVLGFETIVATADADVQEKSQSKVDNDAEEAKYKEKPPPTLKDEVNGEQEVPVKPEQISESVANRVDSKASSCIQFDHVSPPELGSLTQKLYHTSAELAEILALTQSELLIANRRVNALVMEREELLAKKAELLRNNKTKDETLMWLNEKNELID